MRRCRQVPTRRFERFSRGGFRANTGAPAETGLEQVEGMGCAPLLYPGRTIFWQLDNCRPILHI